MNDTTYNGYANYETWNFSLWIDNDQGMHSYIHEYVREMIEEIDDPSDYQYQVAKFLESFMDEEIAQQTENMTGMLKDLLQGAANIIDYYEIADSVIETVLETIEQEKAQ